MNQGFEKQLITNIKHIIDNTATTSDSNTLKLSDILTSYDTFISQ